MYPLVAHVHTPPTQLIVPGEAAMSLGASSGGLAVACSGGHCYQSRADTILDTVMMQQSVAQVHEMLGAAQGAKWSPLGAAAALAQRGAGATSFTGVHADPGSPLANESAAALAGTAQEFFWRAADPLRTSGGMVWVLVMTMCVVVPCLALCIFRQFDRAAVNMASRGPSLTSRPSSASSLASCVRRKQKQKAASSDDELTSAVSLPRRSAPCSARGTRVGRFLSHKIAGSRSASKGSCASAFATPTARELPCRPRASLVVSVNSLVDVGEAGGTLDVRDTLGGPGMSLALSQSAQGVRRLLLFAAGDPILQEGPCASVEPPASQGEFASLELRGPGGVHVGSLTPQEDGTFAVHAQGQPQLVIAGDEDSLNLEVSTRDGRPVAVVGCMPVGIGGPEHVEIDIFQVGDTQLVVSCIFAILLLCGESTDEESS